MGKRLVLISGFNNSKFVSNREIEVIKSLSLEGYDIHRIDYYKHYKKQGSSKLIKSVVQELIDEYYSNNSEPLTIIGWSLGGCITAEALNIISSLNEQLDEDDKIKINKVILFSPAWYISEPYEMLKRKEFASEEVKKLNHDSTSKSIDFFIKYWQAFYHLFNISNFSKKEYNDDDGLNIFKKYDTVCVVPQNDQFINIKKTKEKVRSTNMQLIEIGDYGHLSILVPSVIEEVIHTVKQKKK